MVLDLQQMLGVVLSPDERASIASLSDLHRLLASKASDRHADALVFFRIRRAMAALAPDAAVSATTPLTAVVDRVPGALTQLAESAGGLHIPMLTRSRAPLVYPSLLLLVILLVTFIDFNSLGSIVGLALAAGLLVFSAAFIELDDGRYGAAPQTVGDLARRIGAHNRTLLDGDESGDAERLWSLILEGIDAPASADVAAGTPAAAP